MPAGRPDKPIRLTAHAYGYRFRGEFTAHEVETAIRSSSWQTARNDRWEAAHDFAFHDEWIGKRYAIKRVRPVFVEEEDEIVVIAVCTYFF